MVTGGSMTLTKRSNALLIRWATDGTACPVGKLALPLVCRGTGPVRMPVPERVLPERVLLRSQLMHNEEDRRVMRC